jgi:hypothetical protein
MILFNIKLIVDSMFYLKKIIHNAGEYRAHSQNKPKLGSAYYLNNLYSKIEYINLSSSGAKYNGSGFSTRVFSFSRTKKK